jgi:restriction system protein
MSLGSLGYNRQVIPDFSSIMRPMLALLSDGEQRDTVWLRDAVAQHFKLSPEERSQLLPSGTGRLYDNRVAWAYVHLYHAGAIQRVARATYRITPRGRKLLNENPERIDVQVLSQFPELVAFRKGGKGKRRKNEVRDQVATLDAEKSPTERIAAAHADHEAEIALELMDRIRGCDPIFFEQLVLKVLVAMGYGGSEEEAAEHLGGSGDGGVDGVIHEDRLGLDRIYVQAKRRTEGSVGRPEVQAFVGALDGKGANKGVFITSSHFSPDAESYAAALPRRIVLIDGERLAEFMVRFGVGVTARDTFSSTKLTKTSSWRSLGRRLNTPPPIRVQSPKTRSNLASSFFGIMLRTVGRRRCGLTRGCRCRGLESHPHAGLPRAHRPAGIALISDSLCCPALCPNSTSRSRSQAADLGRRMALSSLRARTMAAFRDRGLPWYLPTARSADGRG